MAPCLLTEREVKGCCPDLSSATLSKWALCLHFRLQLLVKIRVSCRAPRPWRAKACEHWFLLNWFLLNFNEDTIEVVVTFKAAGVIDPVIMLELSDYLHASVMLQYNNRRYTARECASQQTSLLWPCHTHAQEFCSHLHPCSVWRAANARNVSFVIFLLLVVIWPSSTRLIPNFSASLP